MDSFEFIATIIGHLAWPSVLIIGSLTFRKHIGDLLQGITSVRISGFEMNIKNELDVIQNDYLALPNKESSLPASDPVTNMIRKTLMKTLRDSPRIAILDAFEELQGSMREHITPKKGKRVHARYVIENLKDNIVINQAEFEILKKIRDFERQVRNMERNFIPIKVAKEYIELCLKFINHFEEIALKKSKSQK